MTGILNTSRSQVGKSAPGDLSAGPRSAPLHSCWHPPLGQVALCL